ncbi:MAG: NrsF family protein [Pseudomonadota bacterium]
MNTDALIAELIEDLRPVRHGAVARTLRRGLSWGAAASLAVLLYWPALGIRPDIAVAMAGASFWIKLAYLIPIAAIGFLLLDPVARPGGERPRWWRAAVPPFAALIVVTVLSYAAGPVRGEGTFWLGATALQCPFYIVALSLPVLVGLLAALARLAPARPRAAGAMAGLVAGASGAAIYSLHCVETSPGFVLLWYSLGLGAASVAGAVAGQRFLRW